MTPSTPSSYKPRLDAIRTRTSAARQRRSELNAALKLAAGANDFDTKAALEDQLRNCEADLSDAQALENVLLRQISGTSGSVGADSFLADPQTVGMLEQLASSSMPIGNVMLGPALDRDAYASELQRGSMYAAGGGGDIGLPDAARQGLPYGVVGQLRRQLHLIDLISVQTMSSGSFTYVRESGNFDLGVAETLEGTVKPTADIDLSLEGTVVAQTIATWQKVKRQMLADVPGLGTLINSRLTYSVNRRIESQILAGDGVGPNLLGVLNTTGLGVVPFNAAVPLSDLLLSGLTTVRQSNAEPDAVLINPATYAAMLSAKAVTSGERLDSGGAFETAATSVWGVPAIQSNAISPNVAVVGSWHSGATLWIREGLNVRVSDAADDDFTRNRVTVLAETRCGLAVWQPAAFCQVHLA